MRALRVRPPFLPGAFLPALPLHGLDSGCPWRGFPAKGIPGPGVLCRPLGYPCVTPSPWSRACLSAGLSLARRIWPCGARTSAVPALRSSRAPRPRTPPVAGRSHHPITAATYLFVRFRRIRWRTFDGGSGPAGASGGSLRTGSTVEPRSTTIKRNDSGVCRRRGPCGQVVRRTFVRPDWRCRGEPPDVIWSGADRALHPALPPGPEAAVYMSRNVMVNGISIGITGITIVCGFPDVDLSDHCFFWDYIDNRDIEPYGQCVPPVGVEPTLRTLLGGRPLPLGYGGGTIILRAQLPNRVVTTTS